MNLIQRFCNWRARRRSQARTKAFLSGYAWATQILKGEGDERLTSQEILDRCEGPFDGPNPFDAGAVAAVHAFEKEPT
jgi:hypothetical protein